ncbi:MAG: hypothetical protein CL878_08760 [Dehalococcoidia bacterium]|nr:hypothetical protein [Dehalococcoidia bacterium]
MAATGIAHRLRASWTRRDTPRATSADRPPVSLDEAVPGEEVRTAQGRFYRIRTVWPAEGRYGGEVLRAFTRVRPSSLTFLTDDTSLRSFDPRRAVFLDTETTGLAGGTGTYAFLIGLGFFDDDQFVIEQYFMCSFGEERAMMAHVADLIAGFPSVVTFNGRTFDLPLLQTRFTLNRQRRAAALLDEWDHLDLLPPARRLWRESLPNCRLSSLEAAVLGVRRRDDVPSWLIPSIYLDFVRTQDARRLRPVFTHNRYDILTMVALTTYAEQMLARPLELRPGQPRRGAEIAAIARLFDHRRDTARSARLYAAALQQALPADLRVKTLWRLSMARKRQRAWSAAAELWHRMLDKEPELVLPALVELAKYYEHRRPDLMQAKELAMRAYELWQRAPGGPGAQLLPSVESSRRPFEAALLHRVRRLERRLARANASRPQPPRASGHD